MSNKSLAKDSDRKENRNYSFWVLLSTQILTQLFVNGFVKKI